jgi:glycosyltransferase involved in cell wall biosynthesis
VRGVIAGNPLADAIAARTAPGLPRAVLAQTGVHPPLAPAPGSGGGFTIGFAGRLVPEKGLDLLFRACVRLSGSWDIAVVGSGPAQVELEALAERLGIAARVTWHGGLPRADRERLWQETDCIVMPSRTTRHWVETLGVPAVEAMAHGVAVVVTRTGALADTVGDAGIVVPEDDVPALGAALQRLLDERDERTSLAAAGRRRAMQLFTDEALAHRTLEFWRTVAAGTPV